jgi:anti-sigma factor RsiW
VTCRRQLQGLSEYIDGTLSPELCTELEAHLEICENCRIVVDTLSKTVTLYHQLPDPEMPNGMKERLYKVLDISPFVAPDDDPPSEAKT